MRTFILCLCLLSAALSSQAQTDSLEPWRSWPVRQVAVDPPACVTIDPQIVWRLDCAGDSDPLIGRITAAAPGPDGRVLLVDRQLSHVLVVASDGTIERVVGREGEGPGEVGGIHRACVLNDGRIGMVDGTPAPTLLPNASGHLVLLDEAGDPAGHWPIVGEPGSVPVCMVRELRKADSSLLVASMRWILTRTGTVTCIGELALVEPPDGDRAVLARQVREFAIDREPVAEDRSYEAFAQGRCDIHASGRVAFAPDRDRWLVCVREPDGGGTVLERPWNRVERSAERLAEAMEQLGVPRDLVLDHEPALGRLRWRPDGRLWIEPLGLAPQKGTLARFDELSATGELLRRVTIEVPGAVSGDRLLVMEDGRFVVLRGFGSADAEALQPGPEVLLLEAVEDPGQG